MAADHSQTKLLSSGHLTADYMCLILSSQFERTIITHCLILPLNILHQSGTSARGQHGGGSRHARWENKAAEGQGWMPHPRGWTVAPGRSGGGPGGALVLTWDPHLIEVPAALKPSPRKVKENSRHQCC